MRRLLTLCACLALLCIAPLSAQTPDKPHVDLVLVLAVDASRSMDDARWNVQRKGYAAAIRSPEVLGAIRSSRHRSIAISMVAWGGLDEQQRIDDWHVVHDEKSAAAFASLIETMERPFAGARTNIAAAIDFSTKLILDSGFKASHGAPRRVIDVSGDGVQNEPAPQCQKPAGAAQSSLLSGGGLECMRSVAVQNDITVNGLAIKDMPGSLIGSYYQSEVIAGHAAFVIVVENPKDLEAFTRAVRRKLILEIS